MTVIEVAQRLGGRQVCGDAQKEVSAFYAGDFLSRVMGKAPAGCGWLTVMNNINVAGVATLAEVSVIVLCEGVAADDKLKDKCAAEGIGIVETDLPVYECCKAL